MTLERLVGSWAGAMGHTQWMPEVWLNVGFDYDGAEFTHVKNRVTFEVLMASFGLERDPAVAAIAAAVHYLDVGGIPISDARGLETLLRGIKEKARDDDALLAEAMRVLDAFYSAYTLEPR